LGWDGEEGEGEWKDDYNSIINKDKDKNKNNALVRAVCLLLASPSGLIPL
jgi:hypothetical protein